MSVDVRFVPKSGHSAAQQIWSLLDHFVGGRENRLWDCKAKCLGRGEVDGKIELRRLLDWKIDWFCATQNLIHILGRAPPTGFET